MTHVLAIGAHAGDLDLTAGAVLALKRSLAVLLALALAGCSSSGGPTGKSGASAPPLVIHAIDAGQAGQAGQ
ncbi:hypothetical protein ACIBQ1_32145 [Nonomuraea sp. NPDC050153]|uniref:hypothetical protein n=1 Tax=Nonomuraea sp. NPDC050153 TaxID=3364359 RepID=UPI0037A989B8